MHGQRAGFEAVVFGLGCAGDHGADHVGVALYRDVIAALAGVDAALLLHRAVLAVGVGAVVTG